MLTHAAGLSLDRYTSRLHRTKFRARVIVDTLLNLSKSLSTQSSPLHDYVSFAVNFRTFARQEISIENERWPNGLSSACDRYFEHSEDSQRERVVSFLATRVANEYERSAS